MSRLSVLPLLLLLSACQPPAARDLSPAQAAPELGASGSASASSPVSAVPEPSPSAVDASSAAAAPTLAFKVIRQLPHDPAAFTQGLQYVEGRLLESTGLVGESGVRWVNLTTGQPEQRAQVPNPQAFGEGATFFGGRVYQITWQSGEAYRFDQALNLEETYAYQGEGWGLTHDGQQLIMSDGSAGLFFRDPDTFKVTRTVQVTDAGGQPVTQLNELEWAQGAVWANVWMDTRIARIDPQTGRVTGWLEASALAQGAAQIAAKSGQQLTADDVLNGIAFNPENGHFYLTGKRWPVLYEVQISEAEPAGE